MSATSAGNNAARYSVYFAPASNTELAEFGRRVLSHSAIENDHPQRLIVTKTPAHYGFHSTFKAPMELKPGTSEQALFDAIEAFVKTRSALPLNGLAPRQRNGFHALTILDADAVNQMAGDVVQAFDAYRAPLTDADRIRRRPETLSEQQLHNLDTYGYPHVLSEFWFHMTLSHRMTNAGESESYHRWLSELYSNTITETPMLDQLAVFWQPDRGTPFTRVAEFPVN